MINKRVLIFAHDGHRSGASILLLHMCQIIKEFSEYSIEFVFEHSSGELLDEYRQTGNVTELNYTGKQILRRIASRFQNKYVHVLKKVFRQKYDFVVLNTVVFADILPLIRKLYGGKIITYLHELKSVMEFVAKPPALAELFKNTYCFIVPTNAIKNLLTHEYNVAETKIKIVYSFIPHQTNNKSNKQKNQLFVIGGCGSVELRKGTDLFIQVAQYFKKKYPERNVYFRWQGGNTDSLEFKLYIEDIKKLKLDNVQINSSRATVHEFYAGIDVLVLTSREDPYPLVVLEAANAQVPCICFRESGGAAEFVEGNGKVVDYLDTDEVVSAINEYYEHPEILASDGEKAQLKVKALHQDKKKIVEQFFKAVQ